MVLRYREFYQHKAQTLSEEEKNDPSLIERMATSFGDDPFEIAELFGVVYTPTSTYKHKEETTPVDFVGGGVPVSDIAQTVTDKKEPKDRIDKTLYDLPLTVAKHHYEESVTFGRRHSSQFS